MLISLNSDWKKPINSSYRVSAKHTEVAEHEGANDSVMQYGVEEGRDGGLQCVQLQSACSLEKRWWLWEGGGVVVVVLV